MTTIVLLIGAYLAFNFLVFLIYWWDKDAARKSAWRVRESTLLWLAFVGGSAGAFCAQRLLRHKTSKEPFRSILISIILLQSGLVISLAMAPDWPQRLITTIQNSKP